MSIALDIRFLPHHHTFGTIIQRDAKQWNDGHVKCSGLHTRGFRGKRTAVLHLQVAPFCQIDSWPAEPKLDHLLSSLINTSISRVTDNVSPSVFECPSADSAV